MSLVSLVRPWEKDSDMGDGERRVGKWTVTNSVHAKLGLAGVITVWRLGDVRLWRPVPLWAIQK